MLLLPIYLVYYILDSYIHKDFKYVIHKGELLDSKTKKLSTAIIMLNRMEHYFNDILLLSSLGKNLCLIACKYGYIDTVIWISERVSQLKWRDFEFNVYNYQVFNRAIEGGHLLVLKWLIDSSIYKYGPHTWNTTIRFNRLEVLKWVVSQGLQLDDRIMTEVGNSSGNRIHFIIYLRQLGYEWNASVCNAAARSAALYGNLSNLRWLLKNGCPSSNTIFCYAVEHGYKRHSDATLRLLYDFSCSWNESACTNAVAYRCLPCLQWLRQHNCPWNIQECLMYSGHDTEDNDEEMPNWILQFIN